MPVFDTPITTNDASLDRVLAQDLPVLLVLHRGPVPALDETLRRIAKDDAGALLLARIDINENPAAHQRFGGPGLPALVTLDAGEVEGEAAHIRPADLDAHADFLLGRGPFPQSTAAETEAKASEGALPVHTGESTFIADVLRSDVPVLVDFWAPWCGPCHRVAPVLDQIAADYAGRIKVAKLNVDENPTLARQYQAMSIPMLMMFKGGEPVGRLVGAQPRPNIEQMVRQAL